MIRVVIAEDQQMLRGAFASLLKFETDIEVLAEASDGKQAWEAIQKHQLMCACLTSKCLLSAVLSWPS